MEYVYNIIIINQFAKNTISDDLLSVALGEQTESRRFRGRMDTWGCRHHSRRGEERNKRERKRERERERERQGEGTISG